VVHRPGYCRSMRLALQRGSTSSFSMRAERYLSVVPRTSTPEKVLALTTRASCFPQDVKKEWTPRGSGSLTRTFGCSFFFYPARSVLSACGVFTDSLCTQRSLSVSPCSRKDAPLHIFLIFSMFGLKKTVPRGFPHPSHLFPFPSGKTRLFSRPDFREQNCSMERLRTRFRTSRWLALHFFFSRKVPPRSRRPLLNFALRYSRLLEESPVRMFSGLFQVVVYSAAFLPQQTAAPRQLDPP